MTQGITFTPISEYELPMSSFGVKLIHGRPELPFVFNAFDMFPWTRLVHGRED